MSAMNSAGNDYEKKLSAAYEHCRDLARHYENFPVGSLLVPKSKRKHFYALYAFMRTADDFADLPHRPKEERLKLLADWKIKLDSIVDTRRPVAGGQDPVFIALGNTIRQCRLDPQPLYRLLEAFEFDAKGDVHFETFDDLRWYTSRSADPVGQLILALFGYSDPERIRLSNEICTGLQLLNFIQDIKEDLANGRQYYPKTDGLQFKNEQAGWSLLELDRVEQLIGTGAPLAESVSGRLRYELRAVTLSARKMISKIRAINGDTYNNRPKLSKTERIGILVQSMFRNVAP